MKTLGSVSGRHRAEGRSSRDYSYISSSRETATAVLR